jgi:hypothetical protein
MNIVEATVRTTTRNALANWIERHHRNVQYINGRDTLASVKEAHAKHAGIIDFAQQIGAIKFSESLQCHAAITSIHNVSGSLIKCARLPVADGERAKHYAHLQSHSVAACAAHVATVLSVLRA